jgi:photosystem II stability/assembly factor-like uncharacterized protein
LVEFLAAVALAVGPAPLTGPSIAWGGMRAWAGGAGGILSTSDGGVVWRVQSRRPTRQLVAVDATHAWALSRDLTLRTTDGLHWTSLGAQGVLRMSFADRLHGFAIERLAYLMRTTDGGATWTPLNAPRQLQSVCVADARNGWVARGSTVWATRDAGAHWAKRTVVRGRADIAELYCSGSHVWDVVHDGVAAGTEKYTVVHSRDGGTTWHVEFASFSGTVPRVSNYAGAIAARRDGSAVLEGSCAPCGAGSVTFVRVPGARRATLANVRPGPVAFASHTLGLAILTPSPRGTPAIYRTTTGGRTWARTFTSRLLRP